MKVCSKCQSSKDEILFSKNRSKKDGLASECRVCKSQQDRKYKEENKEYYINYLKEYREKNKAELDAKKKEYIANNKSAHLKRQHSWYERNKDSVKTRTLQYKKDHPEQYQMYSNRRKALKKTSIVDVFITQDIVNMYGNQCVYCGDLFTHIDHYIPLSRGGSHTLENVRPSCETCNLTKSNKLPDDFLKYKGNKDD